MLYASPAQIKHDDTAIAYQRQGPIPGALREIGDDKIAATIRKNQGTRNVATPRP
jgi:hypothetical protein